MLQKMKLKIIGKVLQYLNKDLYEYLDYKCIVTLQRNRSDNPIKDIDDLINWNVNVALDPSVSYAAVQLIEKWGGNYPIPKYPLVYDFTIENSTVWNK